MLKKIRQSLLNVSLLLAIVLSLLSLVYAATPNPGHPWTEVGDGNFIATGATTARTYTFPDASATVLTTNSLVNVAQGGTGTSSLSGVLIGNGTSEVTATTSPAGLLVGTTETQTLTGKTMDVNDNSIVDNSMAAGDLFKFNGTKYVRLARGSALQLLRTNAAANDLEWVTLNGSPVGSDQELQYNSGGSAFGSTTSLSWDNSARALKVRGLVELVSTTAPSVAATGTMRLVDNKIAGRSLLYAQTHYSGDGYALQPSLFRNFFVFLATGGSATMTNFGSSLATTGGSVTHAALAASGLMANIPTSGSAASIASLKSITIFFRGSTAGFNGFFSFARVYFPDTSYNQSGATTGSRIFVGMGRGTTIVDSDADGSSDQFGFSRVSTDTRQDAYWTIASNGIGVGAVSLVTTTMAFATSTLYDMYLYCPAQCTSASWRIEDLTNATREEGAITNNLPNGTNEMWIGANLSSVNAVVRNIRVQKLYAEQPK